MNPFTEHASEFLTHSELPIGAEEDLLLLSDPDALRERVGELLPRFPQVLGDEKTRDLQAHLDQADWPLIAQQLRARVEMAAQFFDADSPNVPRD